jgi:hypothetical protein
MVNSLTLSRNVASSATSGLHFSVCGWSSSATELDAASCGVAEHERHQNQELESFEGRVVEATFTQSEDW